MTGVGFVCGLESTRLLLDWLRALWKERFLLENKKMVVYLTFEDYYFGYMVPKGQRL